MNKREREEQYRKFMSFLRILEIRARVSKDERAEEYHNIIKKLDYIKENKYLAIIGEENEESIMHEKILDIICESNSQNGDMEAYEKIKTILANYSIKQSSRKAETIEVEEER